MCEDIPCTEACPTGALDTSRVCSGGGESWYGADCETHDLEIDQARMGIAIIDENSCVAYHDWGLQCDICYRVCPLIERAISLRFERNVRTGKHAFLVPVVDRDECTGCGICEERCITEEAAVKVVPLALVTGKAGDHYQRGWLREQPETTSDQGSTPIETAGPNRSAEGTPESYLNEELEEGSL